MTSSTSTHTDNAYGTTDRQETGVDAVALHLLVGFAHTAKSSTAHPQAEAGCHSQMQADTDILTDVRTVHPQQEAPTCPQMHTGTDAHTVSPQLQVPPHVLLLETLPAGIITGSGAAPQQHQAMLQFCWTADVLTGQHMGAARHMGAACHMDAACHMGAVCHMAAARHHSEVEADAGIDTVTPAAAAGYLSPASASIVSTASTASTVSTVSTGIGSPASTRCSVAHHSQAGSHTTLQPGAKNTGTDASMLPVLP